MDILLHIVVCLGLFLSLRSIRLSYINYLELRFNRDKTFNERLIVLKYLVRDILGILVGGILILYDFFLFNEEVVLFLFGNTLNKNEIDFYVFKLPIMVVKIFIYYTAFKLIRNSYNFEKKSSSSNNMKGLIDIAFVVFSIIILLFDVLFYALWYL